MSLQTLADIPNLSRLTGLITAVGSLGTASYGIVDVTKSFAGGVSNRGFGCIAKTMATFFPGSPSAATAGSSEPVTPPALGLASVLTTLKSNWINGMASEDQLAIAKSLVKLRMDAQMAPVLAALVGVDPATLAAVAAKIASGAPLDQAETDVYGRFDLVLTTVLDQAYQRADQQYRNTAKLCAVIASVVLAIGGAWSLGKIQGFFLVDRSFWEAVMLGLLATPLAPVAKDIAGAIQAGAKVAQAWSK